MSIKIKLANFIERRYRGKSVKNSKLDVARTLKMNGRLYQMINCKVICLNLLSVRIRYIVIGII